MTNHSGQYCYDYMYESSYTRTFTRTGGRASYVASSHLFCLLLRTNINLHVFMSIRHDTVHSTFSCRRGWVPPTWGSFVGTASIHSVETSVVSDEHYTALILTATNTMLAALSNVDARTVQAMLFNFLSSTLIIFTNKALAKNYGFKFSVLLTGFHFIVTYLGGLACKLLGMYEPKKLKHADVFPITAAFVGFVVFNNLSLQENSVGFYQLAKVLTTPVIAILQYCFFGVNMDNRLKLAMFPVIGGVILASVSDVEFNWLGCFWATAGILSTSYYQIFVKTKQASLGANSFQILEYQAPQAALIVLVLCPFMDGMVSGSNQLKDVEWTNSLLLTILASCTLAFCVNLSIFLVVGRTSPITYNVMGHMKLIVILVGGVMLFGEHLSPKRGCGMVAAFVGIVYYTLVQIGVFGKVQDGWEKKTSSNVTEKEQELINESNNKVV